MLKKKKREQKSESAVRELPKEEEEERSKYMQDREDGEGKGEKKLEDWPVKCPAFL